MNVHEDPTISSKSDKSLKENMVVAVEPRCIHSSESTVSE